jgi:hypothetical protein
MVMSVVKVAGLVRMGINGREGSKYPVLDQVIDVAVMAGIYAVIAVLELALRVWRASKVGIWTGGFQTEEQEAQEETAVEQEQKPAEFVAY